MFESRVTDVKIDERRIEVEIVDTAGQEDYEQIRLRSYPNSDVALICFSVDEPDSLEHVVEKWAPEVMHFCPGIPYIVVGCKTDLRFNSRVLEYLTRIGQKPTTPGEGQAVARKSSAEMYLECSSLAGNGIEEVFEHATRAALAAKGKPKKNKRNPIVNAPSQMGKVRKKVVIVGDGGSGKPTSVARFCTEDPHKYLPLEFLDGFPAVFYGTVVEVKLDGTPLELALFDTAGQIEFDRLRSLAYPGTHILLMCFAIDNPTGLGNIRDKWAPEILHFCPNVPYILVGCKTDRRNDVSVLDRLEKWGEKPTTLEDGQMVARQIGARMYLECSAMMNEGVEAVFEHATRVAVLAPKEHKKSNCLVL
ncbi:hypothetical protein FRC17_000121 [Serendipita sp. 399]|nr:hypothetical protein FRC17_000121 [Serendipita sp. 399]